MTYAPAYNQNKTLRALWAGSCAAIALVVSCAASSVYAQSAYAQEVDINTDITISDIQISPIEQVTEILPANIETAKPVSRTVMHVDADALIRDMDRPEIAPIRNMDYSDVGSPFYQDGLLSDTLSDTLSRANQYGLKPLSTSYNDLNPLRLNNGASQRRVSAVTPDVFAAVGVTNWNAELSTLNTVDTQLVQPIVQRLQYAPTRQMTKFGAFEMGVSYVPEMTACRDVVCPQIMANVPTTSLPDMVMENIATWENVLETSVAYSKAIPVGDNDIRVGVAASYLKAGEDAQGIDTKIDEIRSVGVGVNVAYGGLTVEGSLKNTTSDFDGVAIDESYLAYDAGLTYETGSWGFLLGIGGNAGAEEQNQFNPDYYRETRSAQAGVSYMLGHGITIGAAAQFVGPVKSDDPLSLESLDPSLQPENEASIMFGSSYKF